MGYLDPGIPQRYLSAPLSGWAMKAPNLYSARHHHLAEQEDVSFADCKFQLLAVEITDIILPLLHRAMYLSQKCHYPSVPEFAKLACVQLAPS